MMVATAELAENGTQNGEAPKPQLPAQRQSREVRVVEDSGPLANLMDTARFEHLWRIAGIMAQMSVVPDHLCRDKQGPLSPDAIRANCFRIANQALRWGFDPFAIIDETYVVGGKLGYQGKLVAGVVNARAGLEGRLSYSFEGSGDNRTVTVSGRFPGESEPRTSTLRLGDASTSNQMWKRDPDQKLIYSGVVKWARRHCPEVVLGVLTDDDLERIEANRVHDANTIVIDPSSKSDRLANLLESKQKPDAKEHPKKSPTVTAPAVSEDSNESEATGEESQEPPFEANTAEQPSGLDFDTLSAGIAQATTEADLVNANDARKRASKSNSITLSQAAKLDAAIKAKRKEIAS